MKQRLFRFYVIGTYICLGFKCSFIGFRYCCGQLWHGLYAVLDYLVGKMSSSLKTVKRKENICQRLIMDSPFSGTEKAVTFDGHIKLFLDLQCSTSLFLQSQETLFFSGGVKLSLSISTSNNCEKHMEGGKSLSCSLYSLSPPPKLSDQRLFETIVCCQSFQIYANNNPPLTMLDLLVELDMLLKI